MFLEQSIDLHEQFEDNTFQESVLQSYSFYTVQFVFAQYY